MLTVYQDYVVNIFWPTGLSAHYRPDIVMAADSRIMVPSLLILATFGLPFILKKDYRQTGIFWVSFFVIGFLPVSQIVPIVTLMNDRYLYFPMVGLCGFLSLTMDSLSSLPKKMAVFSVGLFLVAMCWLTLIRIDVWNNPVSLWQDATQKQQNSAKVWYALGIAYFDQSNYPKAIEANKQALLIEPSYSNASYNLALSYILNGNFQKAQTVLQGLLIGSPNSYSSLVLLANTYYFLNNFHEARTLYLRVQKIDPKRPDVWNLLSLLEKRAGNHPLSSYYWEKALSLGAKPEILLLNRARLESLKRNAPASIQLLEQAIELGFNDLDLLYSDRDLEFVRLQYDFNQLFEK